MMFTDKPEGQTHYYGDGCGEPAHNEAYAYTKSILQQAADIILRDYDCANEGHWDCLNCRAGRARKFLLEAVEDKGDEV